MTSALGSRADVVDLLEAQHREIETLMDQVTASTGSQWRGGLRSHSGSDGRTKEQLDQEARHANIHGRSTTTKRELAYLTSRDDHARRVAIAALRA